jgi:trigger factor
MNVAIEQVSGCRRRLTIEVPAKRVDEALADMTKEFQKVVRLKGFRPGKAPRDLVEKTYAKEIEEEVKKRLVPEAFREAVASKKLKVSSVPEVEDVKFQRGVSFSFSTLVDLEPEFKLPDYKGIPIQKADTAVADSEVEAALENVRARHAQFNDITGRAVQNGDVAVIDYTGTIGGRPVSETVASAKNLDGQNGFWLMIGDDVFLPGFGKQLVGAAQGESRSLQVTIGDDYAFEELRGKTLDFQVAVKEIKERVLPEFNDDLAKQIGAESAEAFRAEMRRNLEMRKEREARSSHTNQIVEALKKGLNFDLPESSVESETMRVVQDVVQENQMRGIADAVLEEHKADIFANAKTTAAERVKLKFILSRIAEAENIQAKPEEVLREVQMIAQHLKMKPGKVFERMRENGRLASLQDDIVHQKTIDFLLQNASIA